jgi:uncharacterized protein (TIGR03067 family)
MTHPPLTLLLALGPLLAANPRPDSPTQDLKKIQGTWNLVGGEIEGRKLSADEVKKDGEFFIQFALVANRITHKESGKFREQSSFRLLTDQNPRGIDLIPMAGPNRAKVIPGIYLLKEDRLLICLSRVGAERPKKFQAASGSGHKLFILERVRQNR